MINFQCTLVIYLFTILCCHYISPSLSFEWPTWKPKTVYETKNTDKGDDYLNPWLFYTDEKEPENVPAAPQTNFAPPQNNFNSQAGQMNNFGPQQGQMNNFGQQTGTGQMNNPGTFPNGFNNPQSQHQGHQGPQQGFPHNQPPGGNNFGQPNSNNNGQQQSQVKDLFMEPVNNQKPASGGLNPWLSGANDDTPEWAKNPAPKSINEPPRKTKWEMEEEENRKTAKLLDKLGREVAPAYAQDYKNNYKSMVDNDALDSRGNLKYATNEQLSAARRSSYQSREEMIKEGAFQEVPKNYYAGKILPMEETKISISYTDNKLKQLKSPNKRTNKDPPKEVTGKNWIENIMGKGSVTKSALLSIFTEVAFLLVARIIM